VGTIYRIRGKRRKLSLACGVFSFPAQYYLPGSLPYRSHHFPFHAPPCPNLISHPAAGSPAISDRPGFLIASRRPRQIRPFAGIE
jgi:hypothetical protein